MFFVLFASVFAVLLVLLEDKRKISFGFGIAYFIVTFLQAIHYNYGNDYMGYLHEFNYFISFDISNESKLVYHDAFWPKLCYAFKPFGFFGFVAFLSFFQNTVYFYFIRKNIVLGWQAFGVFIYLFTPSLYMLNMSMLRQGLAESIFLMSFMLVEKKNFLYTIFAFGLMLFCGQIHSSAFFFIPFLLLPYIPMKNVKPILGIVLIIFVLLLTSKEMVENVFMFFFKFDQFERFLYYYGNSDTSFDVVYMIFSIPSIIVLFFMINNQNEFENRRAFFTVVERLIFPLSSFVMLAGRMGFYLALFNMVTIPNAYKKLKDDCLKTALILFYVLLALYNYYVYFSSPVFAKYYNDFHTIFEVLF